MNRYIATIKWLDNGNVQDDVIIKVGEYMPYDDDIFFYMDSVEEIEDFKKEGAHDWVIVDIERENAWHFEEGDEYFPIERMPEGELHISRSVWDEVSEELKCIDMFPTLREALNYIEAELSDKKATYSDYQSQTTIEIII